MNTKQNAVRQYRQGDVLIESVEKLPSGLTQAKPEHGKTVLAYGEVTGHHHAFDLEDCTKYTDKDGGEFFEVKGKEIKASLKIVRQWKNQVLVEHPTHGLIEFSKDQVKIEGGKALISDWFGFLKHDEHYTQAIPKGFYKGAGADKTVHQREYSPQEIRRVQD
jgi:hypothetical protein